MVTSHALLAQKENPMSENGEKFDVNRAVTGLVIDAFLSQVKTMVNEDGTISSKALMQYARPIVDAIADSRLQANVSKVAKQAALTMVEMDEMSGALQSLVVWGVLIGSKITEFAVNKGDMADSPKVALYHCPVCHSEGPQCEGGCTAS
jgi:hypothetical protein